MVKSKQVRRAISTLAGTLLAVCVSSLSMAAPDGELFPRTTRINEWLPFDADGFSKPACSVVYDLEHPATDGMPIGGYGTYGYFPPELLMLAMLYMYDDDQNREFAMDKSKRCWENMVLKWRYTWNLINMVRGDKDTGERQIGFDYYQDMMLWVLPIVMEGKNLTNYFDQRGNLIERVLEAGR